MKNGREVAVDSLKTVGAPAKVMLRSDRTTLYADGDDVASIEVDIADADDNLIFTAENTVQFTITGPARSLALPVATGRTTSLSRQPAGKHTKEKR